jgi:hypothetical protein
MPDEPHDGPTVIDALWLNRIQEEAADLILERSRPSPLTDPDVPLHLRGFGV